MTPRGRWKASGDLQNPQKAIDGDVGTAAVSASRYDNAQLTIDLGKICHFSMVVVDHGTNEFGFCRRLAVLTSEDGVTFKNQAAVPGLRRATAVVLPEQVLARYVRLQAVAAGDRPWSVAEVYLN
jgi:hypothetical protein